MSSVASSLGALARLLSPDEQARAARFRRETDRHRFVAAHGGLRQLLGGYLNQPPAALGFVVGEFGKPALADAAAGRTLSFNLSHAGDWILIALAAGQAVGVDVEPIRPDLDFMPIARAQFSPDEVTALTAEPPGAQANAFFRCWTRKEAYLKARGQGLAYSLRDFSVALGAETRPALRWVADDPSAAGRWTVLECAPAAGYAGAVVVEGSPVRLVARPWACGGAEGLPTSHE
ncbi:MAG: 4'-phosphopantetheinyl transferase superfamily protein [Opitutaceae bacterium]|nr:4'-phosphopantetheinyl transferase superfamily protein [Opitutaceae bacterium]